MKPNFVFLCFIILILIVFDSVKPCIGDNVKKSVDENRDDTGETNDDTKEDSFEIPAESNEQINTTACTRRQNSQMHEIKTAVHRQFPFMASIMSQQNEHLCSGTVVSNGIILTSAQCTKLPINHVLLNATKAKKDETTVSLHVIKSEKYPTFTGSSSDKDVGLIYTEKHNSSIAAKVRLSNFTTSRSIVDMEVLGFGLNSDIGQTKELQYMGVENRVVPLHYLDTQDILSGYIDCIDTKVLTCFKDFGGPAIFDNELIGVITTGDDKCFKEMTATYAINKKIVEVLPTYTFKKWLEEKIKKNEEQNVVSLVTYPNNPAARRQMGEVLTENASSKISNPEVVLIFCLNIMLFLCYQPQ